MEYNSDALKYFIGTTTGLWIIWHQTFKIELPRIQGHKAHLKKGMPEKKACLKKRHAEKKIHARKEDTPVNRYAKKQHARKKGMQKKSKPENRHA